MRERRKFDLTLRRDRAATRCSRASSSTTPICSTRRRSRAWRGTSDVLLEAIVADPERALDRAAAARRGGAAAAVGRVERHVHDRSAEPLLARAVRGAGGADAGCGGGDPGEAQLTYGELERRANRLAHHLRALGVGPETLVALCVERSLEMVVGLLGILKAGGAYLPLDPDYPPSASPSCSTDAAPHARADAAALDRSAADEHRDAAPRTRITRRSPRARMRRCPRAWFRRTSLM